MTKKARGWTGSAQAAEETGSRAFTLLELLVVIGVIATLAAMMFPALAKARGQGHRVFCLNNLRQWGLATQMYVVDHDGFLCPDGSPNPGESSTNTGWYVQLPEQAGLARYHDAPWRTNVSVTPGLSPWLCPANRRRSNGKNLFHYCLNGHVNGTGNDNQPVRLDSIAAPASTVWLFDSKNLPAVGYWGYTHTNLHGRGAQFLFLDGHASRFAVTEYWDFVEGRGRTNHPALVWEP